MGVFLTTNRISSIDFEGFGKCKSGADGGTRTRDLFLTKEVLYLLSYISVSMILTVCGDLRLPAFLPPDGFTGVRVPLRVPWF